MIDILIIVQRIYFSACLNFVTAWDLWKYFNSENIQIYTFTCFPNLLEIQQASQGALKHDLSQSGEVQNRRKTERTDEKKKKSKLK